MFQPYMYSLKICQLFVFLKFQAYEVLSDPQKKQIYDEGGEQAIKEGGGRGGGGGFSSPMDIFNMMFGGGMGGMGGGRQSNKTKPMVHKLGVTLEELYNGKVRNKYYHLNNHPQNRTQLLSKCFSRKLFSKIQVIVH